MGEITDQLDVVSVNIDQQSPSAQQHDEMFQLPTGEALNYDEAYCISATYPTKFIVIAGDSQCGKTTLVTTLYQQFLQDIPTRYRFAGSQTIQAFEQRAYLSRSTSKQTQPDTQRTIRDLRDVLHLCLWDCTQDIYSNLLLTDFSGEEFNNVMGNSLLAKEEFQIIRAAHFFLMLIDGEQLCSSRERELDKTINFLKTFYFAELFRSEVRIVVVVSKYDLLISKCKEDLSLQSFIDDIQQRIIDAIPNVAKNLVFMKLAAMPVDSKLVPVGYGLEPLLSLWLSPIKWQPNLRVPIQRASKSQFNLFQERVLR